MALSDCDTPALDEKLEATNGVFVSPLGVQVEVYKNWLYVRDEKAWQEGGGFVKHTVMQINAGDLHYKDLQFRAVRGPQNGVYAVVWATQYQDQVEGEDYKPPIVTGMVGIGVYGYYGDEWVGVEDESLKWFVDTLRKKESETLRIGDQAVETESYVLDVPDVFRELDFGKSLRFNQGDMFFAKELGVPLQASAPGEAQDSILSRAFTLMEEE
jgi:hypothetical protein